MWVPKAARFSRTIVLLLRACSITFPTLDVAKDMEPISSIYSDILGRTLLLLSFSVLSQLVPVHDSGLSAAVHLAFLHFHSHAQDPLVTPQILKGVRPGNRARVRSDG
ncbi:hypothetical protein MTO96_036582 [Rhipicephalus appendiculatus]